MAETQKRLKKNISFSAHEKDIYDYLEKQGNASAFIKRLILNQMMIDTGIVTPIVTKVKEQEVNVQCETPNKDNQTEEVVTVISDESQDSSANESSYELQEEDDEELAMTVETNFTKEDLETIQVLPDL